MYPENWITAVFGSRLRVDLLRALAADPARTWTERELADRIGASPNATNIALRWLRDQGVLHVQRFGRTHAVGLRAGTAVTRHLEAIFREEAALMDEIEATIRRHIPPGVACVLFGSAARGQATAASDLDLLIIAPTREQAEEVAAAVRWEVATLAPVRLEIISLGAADAAKRERTPWLMNARAEGRLLSSTPLAAVA